MVDLLFIENVGNLICPVGFDLGQAAKVGLFSLTEGDDKAAKHPYPVQAADLLNPRVSLLDVSATTGEGLDAWIAWLDR